MRRLLCDLKKMCLLTLCFAILGGAARATSYTAVLSGDFNSAATWGGIAPGLLLSTDVVFIPAGITVTLTSAETFSGSSSIIVDGTLTSATAGSTLIINSGGLSGIGNISVDSMVLGLSSGFSFTGAITARSLTSNGASISSFANITVNRMLTLNAGVLDFTSGTLVMGAHSMINRAGGSLTASGTGTLTLTSPYSVTYSVASATTGMELNGANLDSVVVNVPGTVTLAGNQTINGTLMLSSGTLALNGNTLTFGSTGDLSASGTGSITGSALSNIEVNTTGNLIGALRFATGGNTLNNLTVNSTSGGSASLGSDVTVDGFLALTSGMLALNGHALTFGTTGNITLGTGSISGSSTSDIIINATAGLSDELRFDPSASLLRNLTVNTGAEVLLGSSLTLDGTLTLTAGTVNLNSYNLTFGATGNLATSGTGSFVSSSASDLIINATAGLSGSLRFAPGSNQVNNLTVNTASGSTTSLGGDLSVDGALSLTSGALALNGHNLTLGTGSSLSSGTGSISGSATSGITVNSTAGLTGLLRFSAGSNMLDTLWLNTASGSSVSLGSDLVVDNLLNLSSGTLFINGHTLTLNTSSDLAAFLGRLGGSSTSNLVVNATGLTGTLNFASSTEMLNNLTINSGATGVVGLGSDLAVNGMVTLTSGMLALNDVNFTFNGTSDLSASGTGSFMGSASAGIVINATGSLTGSLHFATGSDTLRTLSLGMGGTSDVVNLGSNLTITDMLTLTTGKLKLGANNLHIATGGMLNGGNSSSYVMTDATGSLVMNLASGSTDSFQVGTSTNYAPVAVIANSGSASGDVTVNVMDGVYSAGTTGTSISATERLVNATWHVSSSATTGINYNLVTMWSTGMELNGFNRTHAYISHYTGGAWDVQTPTAAVATGGMYSITRTGLTSLSPFMVSDEFPMTTGTQNVVAASNNITVYPNPATSTLHFSTSSDVENVWINDMAGKMMKSAVASDNAVSIAELPSGEYFINFTGKNFSSTQKFIKQ